MTKRQFEALRFIKGYIASHGCAPSVIEVAEAIGSSSKSHAHRVLRGLEDQGYIRRLPKRARAIEVIENPTLLNASMSLDHLKAEAKRRNLHLCHAYRDHYGERIFVPL